MIKLNTDNEEQLQRFRFFFREIEWFKRLVGSLRPCKLGTLGPCDCTAPKTPRRRGIRIIHPFKNSKSSGKRTDDR